MFQCLPNGMELKKYAQKKFHLTRVTVGGEAKMESGHTFLPFFLTLPLGC